MSNQIRRKYVTGISPAISNKKQSMDILIYFEGFPTVFETLEKKDGVLKLNVKMIEIT